mgnify:FL=1|tara:strand:- start:569 stop:775 length:207 start_codon:yes stop_codon:yes gene_type:complete
MSGEQITHKELNKTPSMSSYSNSNGKRVNINNLLRNIRDEKSKEKKENYVFLGLVVSVLAVTGIIASL